MHLGILVGLKTHKHFSVFIDKIVVIVISNNYSTIYSSQDVLIYMA